MIRNFPILGFHENRGPIAYNYNGRLDSEGREKIDVTGLFNPGLTFFASIPFCSLSFALDKIMYGIIDDGSAFNVIEADRGLKFRAIMILVGVVELCCLGLLVHGVASLYFAATEPSVEENNEVNTLDDECLEYIENNPDETSEWLPLLKNDYCAR